MFSINKFTQWIFLYFLQLALQCWIPAFISHTFLLILTVAFTVHWAHYFFLLSTFYFFLRFIYLRDRESVNVSRERGRGRERQRTSSWLYTECEAQHGAQSQDPEILTAPKSQIGNLTDWTSQVPLSNFL